jgi:hypothetical protein
MTTTAGRPAADEIPEGFARPGCRICGRIARGEYASAGGYWRIDADTGVYFDDARTGHLTAVPAAHPADPDGDEFARYKVAAMYAWLARYATEVAAGHGLADYDLLISVEDGHPQAEIRHRRLGKPGFARWLLRAIRRDAQPG